MNTFLIRRRTRNEDGLTLVEMMVAVAVIMTVMVAAMSLMVTAKRGQARAEGTDRAVQLANAQLERMRQLDWRLIGFREPEYNAALAGSAPGATTTNRADYYPKLSSRDCTPTGIGVVTSDTCTVKLSAAALPFCPTVGAPTPGCIRSSAVIRPYFTTGTEYRDQFTVYTSLTWGVNPTISLPATSATTLPGQYTFKRARVTVEWTPTGTTTKKSIVNETWFAPEGHDLTAPGVPVVSELSP